MLQETTKVILYSPRIDFQYFIVTELLVEMSHHMIIIYIMTFQHRNTTLWSYYRNHSNPNQFKVGHCFCLKIEKRFFPCLLSLYYPGLSLPFPKQKQHFGRRAPLRKSSQQGKFPNVVFPRLLHRIEGVLFFCSSFQRLWVDKDMRCLLTPHLSQRCPPWQRQDGSNVSAENCWSSSLLA